MLVKGCRWAANTVFTACLLAGVSTNTAAQVWVQNSDNGHSYALTTPMTWNDAQNKAVEWGGYLATVNDAAENTWITDNLVVPSGTHCFVGGNDIDAEGTWVWVEDGGNFWNGDFNGSVVPSMYANWAVGTEPNDTGGNEDACEIRTDGFWNDISVTTERPGVVEIDRLAGPWVQNPDNFHWYRLTDTLTWEEAQNQAVQWGGYLATIDDTDENAWVHENIVGSKGANCFIGGNDLAAEGTWVWVENGANFWNGQSTGNVVSGMYANWNNGEPNNSNGNEDICEIRTDGLWNDSNTGTTRPGVVEVDQAIGYIIEDSYLNLEAGDSYTLSVAVTRANEPVTYQWQKDGNNIAGATTATYELTDLTEADTGSYTCVITDAVTSISTSSIFLRVWSGALPVSGALGIGLLAGAFALVSARILRRK